MTKKILFVTHQCSGTGAPILLLSIMRALKHEKIFSTIDVLALQGGELENSFRDFGGFWFYDEICSSNELLLSILGSGRYDVVYFNTVETVYLIGKLTSTGVIQKENSVISHVHELDGTIIKAGTANIEYIKKRADKIICVSRAVKENLNKYNVDLTNVQVIPPFLEREFTFRTPQARFEGKTFTILGCGEITVGKGVDVFLQVAKKSVDKYGTKFRFVWLGQDSNKIKQYFLEDINKWALQESIEFAGFQTDVEPWFASANLFFMASRQDSFPLVCLEAASSGLPIMYFKDAGGIKELLGDSCGLPLRYLDIDHAVETIGRLSEDKQLQIMLASSALNAYNAKCGKSIVISKLLEVIYK